MPESCVYTLQHTRNHLRNLPQIARKHCCERCKPKMEIAEFKVCSVTAPSRVRHSCTTRVDKELKLISRAGIKSKENLRQETICGRTDAEQMEIKIRTADKAQKQTSEHIHVHSQPAIASVINIGENCEIKSDTASDGRPSTCIGSGPQSREFAFRSGMVPISRAKDFNGLRWSVVTNDTYEQNGT